LMREDWGLPDALSTRNHRATIPHVADLWCSVGLCEA
jgi:hypothetical protein